MDYAIWGQQDGRNDTRSVQELLARYGAARRPNGQAPKSGSRCGQTHDRACSVSDTGPEGRFLSAAYAGRRQCVLGHVAAGGDLAVKSRSGHRNAIGWATHEKTEGLHTDWVMGFLESQGVKPVFYTPDDGLEWPWQREPWRLLEVSWTPGGQVAGVVMGQTPEVTGLSLFADLD